MGDINVVGAVHAVESGSAHAAAAGHASDHGIDGGGEVVVRGDVDGAKPVGWQHPGGGAVTLVTGHEHAFGICDDAAKIAARAGAAGDVGYGHGVGGKGIQLVAVFHPGAAGVARPEGISVCVAAQQEDVAAAKAGEADVI